MRMKDIFYFDNRIIRMTWVLNKFSFVLCIIVFIFFFSFFFFFNQHGWNWIATLKHDNLYLPIDFIAVTDKEINVYIIVKINKYLEEIENFILKIFYDNIVNITSIKFLLLLLLIHILNPFVNFPYE